jgi:hypothetical protein
MSTAEWIIFHPDVSLARKDVKGAAEGSSSRKRCADPFG